MKNLIAILAALPLLASCDSWNWHTDPATDPNPVVVDEFVRLGDALDDAVLAESRARALVNVADTPQTRDAWEDAVADLEDAQAAFDEWEHAYFVKENGPIVAGIASVIGAWNPAAQGAALALGSFGVTIAASLFTRRGRRHVGNAGRRLAPGAKKRGMTGGPIAAVVDLKRALGWTHSTPDTEAVAEGKKLALPPEF